jgi:hypothetical protein
VADEHVERIVDVFHEPSGQQVNYGW